MRLPTPTFRCFRVLPPSAKSWRFAKKATRFFPAEQAGGAAYLKALSSPLAGMIFCPTGGISLKNANDYLSLPNVVCVGGSWVAPKELVAAGDWAGITKLAAEAAALKA